MGEKEKCKYYILTAVTAYGKCQAIWPYAEFHIVLPAGKKESIPSWLQNEELKYLFLLCSGSEPVCVDALMLMNFLYFKIENKYIFFDEVEYISPRSRYYSFALLELKKNKYHESLLSKDPQKVSLVKYDLMVAAGVMTILFKEERIYDKLMQLIFEENRNDIFGQIYSSSYIKHRFTEFDEAEKVMVSLLKTEENVPNLNGCCNCCVIV